MPLCCQVLKDDTSIADNNIAENTFLVVMVQKARTYLALPSTVLPQGM